MNITWKNCFRIGISALLLFLCIHYCDSVVSLIALLFNSAMPVIIGLIIAYLLNILMNFYERHYFIKFSDRKIVQKTCRPVCMLAAMLTFCGIIALIIRLVIPELLSCVKFLILEIPPAIEKLLRSEWVSRILPEDILSILSGINWKEYISKIVEFLTSGIGSAVSTIITAVSSIFSGIVTAFIGIIFAVYLMLGKEKLCRQCKRLMRNYLRPAWIDKIMYGLHLLNNCFHRYIVGQCTEAVILGVLCIIGMLFLKIPYAVMIGTLIGFTALIPVAGAYIGAVIGAIMILTVSPIKAVVFIIFLVILQQLEGNLIYPQVVGDSIGLPAIWVLAAVTIGGGLMGITGMLIGVPITAAIYRLLRENMTKRENEVKLSER